MPVAEPASLPSRQMPPISSHQLDNGLRIALAPDPRVPVVSASLWYGVASAHEREGRSGFAHLFEHMMFQGSANVAKAEHFALVQAAGGRTNAYTGVDATVYQDTLPSHELELALWLEADRMATLGQALTQEKLDNQRDVVKNERRKRVDNVPYGSWEERCFALAFPPAHPYHRSSWGSMEDLSAASLQDVQAFFASFYVPNNAALTLVGDFQADGALDIVDRHFGAIPRAPDPPGPDGDATSRAHAATRDEQRGEVPMPGLYLACQIPALGDADFTVAELIVDLLVTGRASRLQSRLVREQRVAQKVDAWTMELVLGASLIVVEAIGRPETEPAALEAALDAELDRLASDPPSEGELARVRLQRATKRGMEMQTVERRADRLGMYAALLNDPSRFLGEGERDVDIGPEEVRALARTWLRRESRKYVWYLP
jgi:predicted Zn-dependent peptidase